jgi:hypothetical protein
MIHQLPIFTRVGMSRREDRMGDFGYVALIIFVIIRVLIAAGLLYLIVIEVRRYIRRYRGHKVEKDEKTDGDANGKNIDNSLGSRS